VEVRHPLDILINDVGLDKIQAACKYEFQGLKVAPYYGCQIVRPVYHFDDIDEPQTMDHLLGALGIEVVDYPDKVRCCGGMLMTTFEDIAYNLNNHLLVSAEANGAELIATACPLCQMNLEAYQPQINQKYNLKHNMPILYFSQLVALAMGIDPLKIGLNTMIVELKNLKLKPKSVKVAV
jgi:heterodisulfide reductase subunit B